MKRWLVLVVGLCVVTPVTLSAQTPARPPVQLPTTPAPVPKPQAAGATPKALPGPARKAAKGAGPTPGPSDELPPGAIAARSQAFELLKRAIKLPALRKLNGITKDIPPSGLGLLEPVPQFLVPLSRLTTYEITQDPETVMVDQQRLLIPVTSGGAVFSSITIVSRGEVWRAAAFGPAFLARSIVEAKQKLEGQDSPPGSIKRSYRVVTIGGLNRAFLWVATSGAAPPLLIPLFADSDFPKDGQPKTAAEVLSLLVYAAKAHNGFPT